MLTVAVAVTNITITTNRLMPIFPILGNKLTWTSRNLEASIEKKCVTLKMFLQNCIRKSVSVFIVVICYACNAPFQNYFYFSVAT